MDQWGAAAFKGFGSLAGAGFWRGASLALAVSCSDNLFLADRLVDGRCLAILAKYSGGECGRAGRAGSKREMKGLGNF